MTVRRPTLLYALPVLALTAGLLAGCAPATPDDSPDPVESSSTPTPTPTPTESEETDEGESGGDTSGADAAMRANIVDAMSSGNTAALEGYFAPSVYVKYAASEQAGFVTDHVLLVNNLSYVTSPTAVWDFDLPASVIDNYANNPGSAGSYIEDFPAGALVGRSSEDKVISFTLAGGQITRIFIANTEYALTFE
jgi:hypothetical protein